MVKYNEWLAHSHADELLQELKDRKEMWVEVLQAASAADEILRAGHFVQATNTLVGYLEQRIKQVRIEVQKNEN